MKTKFTILAVLMSIISYSQWTYKTIKSDFDGDFKKAFTQTNNGGYLMMEVGQEVEKPFFALSGMYFCDDNTLIDFVFIVNGISKKYELNVTKSSNSRIYYFSNDVWTDEFIKDFKDSSKCLIRVNQEYCQNDYYEFNMNGSSSAFNFITK